MEQGTLRWELHRLAQVDSTNTYLKERCQQLSHGTAVFTDCQTAGRGRRGNQWCDSDGKVEPGASLALSFLLRDGVSVSDMGLLPLLCALAVGRALRQLTQAAIGIKWPNDMICQGKKLCGILCESRIGAGQSAEEISAICGIGVNLTQSPETFSEKGLPHAVSLKTVTGKVYTPEEVAQGILEAFSLVYREYREQGFSALLPEYQLHCVTLGKPVRILWEQETREGVAVEINPLGELVCSIDGVLRTIRSGEASVRGLLGYL